MNTTRISNNVSCQNCKHYEYKDSKASQDGFWHWGYCHKSISRDFTDEQSFEDLSEYFQVAESHFCGYFKYKGNICSHGEKH